MFILMPISPAFPNTRAHRLQAMAAMTPNEMRVSMVVVRCAAFRHADLWKGHAHHVDTGAASTNETHCQPSNCRAPIIDMAITGVAHTTATTNRRRTSTRCASVAISTVDSPSSTLGATAP